MCWAAGLEISGVTTEKTEERNSSDAFLDSLCHPSFNCMLCFCLSSTVSAKH